MRKFEIPQVISYPPHVIGFLADNVPVPKPYSGPVRRVDAREIVREHVDRNPQTYRVSKTQSQAGKSILGTKLARFEREIALAFIEGLDADQISVRLNKSRKQVLSTLSKVRGKLGLEVTATPDEYVKAMEAQK